MSAPNSKRRKRRAVTTPASALPRFKWTILFLFLVSGVVSLLALNGAFYMLQIYDRALPSQSIETLVALSVLAIGLYLFHGVLDVTRSQIMSRLGAQFDRRLAPLAHRVAVDMPRYGYSAAESRERSRDVDVIRQFMSGQGPIAMLDLPWSPMYIGFIYILHPWLGLLTLGGAVVLALIAVATEFLTRRRSVATQRSEVERTRVADSNSRNAEILRAMGLTSRAVARFEESNQKHLELHARSSNLSSSFSGFAKMLRMVLQSAVLGLGAYLAITQPQSFTPGAIIAASVAASRALAPIDMAIGQWKNLSLARRSYARLKETLSGLEEDDERMALPTAAATVKAENVTIAAPGSTTAILSDISFELQAGNALAVIGPSGCGKSSLARALIGVWPLARGAVRLDGAELDQFNEDQLGQHVGYLPQDVSLFDATVAENIARLEPEPDSQKILAAATAAGVHEMIVRLPDGYQTELGPNGSSLSAGQRQRIALARALYGDPFLVVLDEPNSNLDREGDAALTRALESVKSRGGVAVVITHRPSGVSACDLVAVVQNGRLAAFGPKDEVLGNGGGAQGQGQAQGQTPARQPRVDAPKIDSAARQRMRPAAND